MPSTPTTRRRDPSPRKTLESASSSIFHAVTTSVSSARKITDRARSYVPKKLLAAQCTYTPVISNRSKERDIDATTPVIFYRDEDDVVKRAAPGAAAFVDPFSFEDTDSLRRKEDEELNSPTSVALVPVRLFPAEEEEGEISKCEAVTPVAANKSIKKEKRVAFNDIVTFDCPVFTPDTSEKINDEDTSIAISESIKSINALSVSEETRSIRDSIRAISEEDNKSLDNWQGHVVSWDGFAKAASYQACKWEAEPDQE